MKLHAELKSAICSSVVGLGMVVLVCIFIGATRSGWPDSEATWPMPDNVAGMPSSVDVDPGESRDAHTVAPIRVGYLAVFGAPKAQRNDDPFAQH